MSPLIRSLVCRLAAALAAPTPQDGVDLDGDMWRVGAKLAPDESHRSGAVGRFGHLMRLVLLLWGRACQSTRVHVLTQAILDDVRMGPKDLEAVRRCGPHIEHNCRFYTAQRFEARTGVAFADSDTSRGPAVGYFVYDSMWYPLEASPEECVDISSFHFITHPLRHWHPRGLAGWAVDRLAEQGVPVDGTEGRGEDARFLATGLKDVCVDDVRAAWASLQPGGFSARHITIIGCGTLEAEPTQPLLEKGAGGLFVDGNPKLIRGLRRSRWVAPHRVILNSTVTPANVLRLLAAHPQVVELMEVLQVDIDTLDGPVVMRILDVARPQAVVVEVRNFVPFPLRYAFLEPDTDGLSWGGATLNYWIYELRLRGYELAKMDVLDAIFVRRPADALPSERRKRWLGVLACYLRNLLREPSPAFFLRAWPDSTDAGDWASAGASEAEQWLRLKHAWMEAPPSEAVGDIWRNLTARRGDLRFSLDV